MVKKKYACNAGDPGSVPGSGRFFGEENNNPPQYPCLENPMGRGAWRATVHGVAKSQTRLRTEHNHEYMCTHMHTNLRDITGSAPHHKVNITIFVCMCI